MHTVHVWDLPTRVFHWALALCVVGLLVTGSVGGSWMNWHLRLGYAVLTLLLFRLVWGLVGGYWSRFSSFVYAPSAVRAYLQGQGRPEQRVGHNPLGALSVFALLVILLLQVVTGLFSDDEIAFTGPLVALVSADTVSQTTAYHKNVGKLIVLVLVVLHLGAIAYHQLVRKDYLVRPMISGDKQFDTLVRSSADTARTRLLALAVLAVCAALVYGLVGLGADAAMPAF